jgi:hypothetical protein
MPVKARAAKDRRPSFSAEALELFAELERTSQRSRRFKDGSRELARLLGLVEQWWAGQHVHNRSSEPCHPEGHFAHDAWFRCRAVRVALLAATRERRAAPRAPVEPPTTAA